jgi:hypothetical protein
MVTLLVMTDGHRPYLEQTLTSFHEMVDTTVVSRSVVIDDCAEDPDFVEWVDTLGFDLHVRPGPARRGYSGAVQTAWNQLTDLDDTDHVLHLEDDFIFKRPWDVAETVAFLHHHPYIAQVALRRQGWHSSEDESISIVDLNPALYTEHHDHDHDWHWLEHTAFWTMNPCLYPVHIIRGGWPQGAQSETRFGARLRDAGLVNAYWGRRDDRPWVMHIGFDRDGFDY